MKYNIAVSINLADVCEDAVNKVKFEMMALAARIKVSEREYTHVEWKGWREYLDHWAGFRETAERIKIRNAYDGEIRQIVIIQPGRYLQTPDTISLDILSGRLEILSSNLYLLDGIRTNEEFLGLPLKYFHDLDPTQNIIEDTAGNIYDEFFKGHLESPYVKLFATFNYKTHQSQDDMHQHLPFESMETWIKRFLSSNNQEYVWSQVLNTVYNYQRPHPFNQSPYIFFNKVDIELLTKIAKERYPAKWKIVEDSAAEILTLEEKCRAYKGSIKDLTNIFRTTKGNKS